MNHLLLVEVGRVVALCRRLSNPFSRRLIRLLLAGAAVE